MLEAAASTVLRRKGVRNTRENRDELISLGWEYVFFYAKSYDEFRQYGYLHAIRMMARYLNAKKVDQREILMSPGMEEVLEEVADPYDEPIMPMEQMRDLTREMFAAVPKAWRCIVRMRLRGLTVLQISVTLGCSPSTVSWRYHQSIKRMRCWLLKKHPELFDPEQ